MNNYESESQKGAKPKFVVHGPNQIDKDKEQQHPSVAVRTLICLFVGLSLRCLSVCCQAAILTLSQLKGYSLRRGTTGRNIYKWPCNR